MTTLEALKSGINKLQREKDIEDKKNDKDARKNNKDLNETKDHRIKIY